MTHHEALQALAQAAGLPQLRSNARGVAELAFGQGAVSIYLTAVEDGQLEVSMRLPGMQAGAPMQDWLLAENGRRHFGRLALEPGTDRVVFCHRLHLDAATPATLTAAVNRTFREVARLEARADSLARDMRHAPAPDLGADGLLRL